jgi:uncharacterized protein YegP (UPF0339 family)
MSEPRLKRTNDEENGRYYFSLLAEDGSSVLRSEIYNSKQARDNGIESVRKNAADRSKYEKLESEDGRFYFNLKAGNGQVIATSKLWDREVDRDSDIDFVAFFMGDEG